MLSRLKITLRYDKNIKMNQNISSLLQGVLMEHVSYETALKLHNGGRQPYSQYVEVNKEEMIWNIQALTKEAYDDIIVPMLGDEVKEIYLRHKDLELPIIEKKVSTVSYDTLRKEHYFTDGNRYQTIQFVSPVSFKSQGEYINYPSVHFLFQSLMMKYDSTSDESNLYGQAVMDHFEENIKIVRYHLRSYDFHLEGTKIPAFVGEITLKMRGPRALVNLADYLLAYGEYAGVGIKCGIGMGGIRLKER